MKKIIEKKLRKRLEELKPDFSIDSIIKSIREKGKSRIYEDFSRFIEGKDRNGGGYGFWTNIRFKKDKKGYFLEFEENSTADFDFCWKCGDFHNSYSCKKKPITISI